MTKDYFGTKRVTAWEEQNSITGDPGYGVRYADGYVSWAPKKAFEEAYTPTTAMTFGHALVAMNSGHRVARAGWNGKGMWIALTPPSIIKPEQARSGAAVMMAVDDPDADIHISGHIDMRAADGKLVIGWLASQTDMRADDWTIVE